MDSCDMLVNMHPYPVRQCRILRLSSYPIMHRLFTSLSSSATNSSSRSALSSLRNLATSTIVLHPSVSFKLAHPCTFKSFQALAGDCLPCLSVLTRNWKLPALRKLCINLTITTINDPTAPDQIHLHKFFSRALEEYSVCSQ